MGRDQWMDWIWHATFALLILFCLPTAQAVTRFAPELSILDAPGHLSSLRIRWLSNAVGLGDFDAQFDSKDSIALSSLDFLSQAGSVAANSLPAHLGIHSEAEFSGLVQVGKIRGFTRARVENGATSARADLYMQFMDVIRVDKAGKLDFTLDATGTVTDQLHPTFPHNINAVSSAKAEVYVWPFGTMPTPGQAFDFTLYESVEYLNNVIVSVPAENMFFPPGSRWWLMTQLSLNSTARANALLQVAPPPKALETAARFDHTVELFINPDPSTPDASFTAASEFDYRTPAAIPEPSTWLLFGAGMSLLLLRQRLRMD
jgi:hypothetical protein